MCLDATLAQITKAKDQLGISRKYVAIIVRQANDPANLAWRDVFWSQTYAYDVSGLSSQDLINFHEATIYLETCD